MDRCRMFAKRLDAIRAVKNINMTAFSEELGVPKSTLQAILKDGNTSLHTAQHIADRLNVPLSSLTDGAMSWENLDSMAALLNCFAWFAHLSREEQEKVSFHISEISEVLRK